MSAGAFVWVVVAFVAGWAAGRVGGYRAGAGDYWTIYRSKSPCDRASAHLRMSFYRGRPHD